MVGLTLIPTVVFTAAFLSVLWEFGYQVSKPGGGGGSCDTWMTNEASWMVYPMDTEVYFEPFATASLPSTGLESFLS